jgi:hypothetical protein
MNTTTPSLELHAIEKRREEELEEARAIQSVMLPAESLRSGAVTVSHEFQPIAAVGGDFLDYFELTDKSVGLYLGDVSGKGLAAALYAALAVGTLRGVHKTGTSPSDVLAACPGGTSHFNTHCSTRAPGIYELPVPACPALFISLLANATSWRSGESLQDYSRQQITRH